MPGEIEIISLVVRWHLILNVPDQRDAHFCRVVTTKNVAHELSFDLDLDLRWISRQWTIQVAPY